MPPGEAPEDKGILGGFTPKESINDRGLGKLFATGKPAPKHFGIPRVKAHHVVNYPPFRLLLIVY